MNYRQLPKNIQQQVLDDYYMGYGKLFLNIAYEALSNAANVVNCEKPVSCSSVVLSEGVTRFSNSGDRIEYCCRAKLLPGFSAPYLGANKKLTAAFNAVAIFHQIPERFIVSYEPYPADKDYIVIVATPL